MRSATAAHKMFYFYTFKINLITGRRGWSDSDTKSPSLNLIPSRLVIILIDISPNREGIRFREGDFVSESDQPLLPVIKLILKV